MPIALSILHSAYAQLYVQGDFAGLLAGLGCPRCGDRLALSGRLVRRPLTVMRSGCCHLLKGFEVALAVCVGCGYSPRLLPADALAGRRYSTGVLEAAARAYLQGSSGLRPTVHALGFHAPHFTTLHGWLGGLGGLATGLSTPKGAVPVAALLEETRRRILPDLEMRWRQEARVDPRCYRSERRREEPLGVVRLLRIATAVVAALRVSPGNSALATWIRLASSWSGMVPVAWSARGRGTRAQPQESGHAVGFGGDRPNTEDTPCQTRSRSPPSASR